MPTEVYAYRTEDGKLFSEESDAIDYELETRFRSKINGFVHTDAHANTAPNNIIEFIIQYRKELFEIFKEELE